MKSILLALFLVLVPVARPTPLPCCGTRCVCKVPLQPTFTRHADGSVNSRCRFVLYLVRNGIIGWS